MAEPASFGYAGGGSLTRQERLLYLLVENFQPVWREIDEARVFRQRCLARSEGLLVPQHVMIGVVMLRGLRVEAGAGPDTWSALVRLRDVDAPTARQFKRWMNGLSEYFGGTRPLQSVDLGHLALGLTAAHPETDFTVETLTVELLAYAHPQPSSATRQQRVATVSTAVQRPPAVAGIGTFLADAAPMLATGFQHRAVGQQAKEMLRTAGLPPVVLCGPAGVGKSQLAAALVEDFAPDKVIWVSDASSRPAVLEAYARAAQALGIATADPGDLEVSARSLTQALHRSDFDWWIVLDDVDDPAVLRGLWPGGPRGRTLWLTRRRAGALQAEGRQTVSLEGFSDREGQRYLHARLDGAVAAGDMAAGTFDEADSLVRDLGGTPLALALAASVMQQNRYTCASYRRLLASQLDGLDGLFPADPTAEGYERPVVAAWAISLERAERHDPTRLASWAALLTAVLNPAGVGARIITTEAVRRFLAGKAEDGPSMVSIDDLTHMWRALETYSLVSCTRYDNGGELKIGEVQMHPLTARMTRHHLGEEAVAEAVVAAADALMELWGPVENNPRRNLDLRGNAIWLERLGVDALASSNGVHPVLIKLGWSFGESGRSHRAARYFERLTDRAAQLVGPDHPDAEEILFACGVWHRKEGKIPLSLRELTTLVEGMHGDDERSERRSIYASLELATTRGWTGQIGVARDDLSALIEHATKSLGPEDRLTLRVRYTHAVTVGRSGQYAEAAELLALLLPIQRRVLGTNNVATLRTRLGLATWTGLAGAHKDALLQLLEQRDDWVRVCGPDHPDTLRMRHILAQTRGRLGDRDVAQKQMRKVYRRRRQVLGERHPDTLKSRQDLAVLRGQLGNPQGAVFALVKVLRDHISIQGPRSINTLRTRRYLAEWIGLAGHPATGLAELAYLHADLSRNVEPGHPELTEVTAAITALEELTQRPSGPQFDPGEPF